MYEYVDGYDFFQKSVSQKQSITITQTFNSI